MKLLAIFSLLWLFPFIARPEGTVSYRIENRTADTIIAEAWIDGSCWHQVGRMIPPGQTRELYLDEAGRYAARKIFEERHKHLMKSLHVYRCDAALYQVDSLISANADPVDIKLTYYKTSGWSYHRRPRNNGIAVMVINSSDLEKP